MCSRLTNKKYPHTLLDRYVRELVRSKSDIYWLEPPRYLNSITRESELTIVIHLGNMVSEEELDQVIYPHPFITIENDTLKEVYRSPNGFTARQLFDIVLDAERSTGIQEDQLFVVGLARQSDGSYRIRHM